MNDKEKILKAFNQCCDALNSLDSNSIMKVFQLLSIHFDIITLQNHNEPFDKKVDNSVVLLTSEQINHGDSNIEATAQTKTIKSSKSTKSSKGKTTQTKGQQYLTEFDFRPVNKESLKDFYSKYDSKTNFERNLVFIYYFQEVIKLNGITMNHIYSCYRHLTLKIPVFPQTLIDTKKNKGWIETSDTDNLKVTREGLNYIEHEFAKRKD